MYPEHRDYDPRSADPRGFGDLYPTNAPYLIISQGSSGSDMPFVNAFVKTLAAFRPEVKTLLLRTGLLIPALQAIFRQRNRMVRTRGGYLSGVAHPSVFADEEIDALAMVRRAHAMTPETVPPLVKLQVLKEQQPVPGIDFFESSERDISETLSDTPCVIARIVRGRRYERVITVSAEQSFDIEGESLTFHWKVLRGNADRIRIETSGDAEQVARITVPYHGRRPIRPGAALHSTRVDIGVFAESSGVLSAPLLRYLLQPAQRAVRL